MIQKKMMFLLSGAVFIPLLLSAQVLTIDPQAPKIGDRVSITYNASAQGAVLSDVKEIEAGAMLMHPDGLPVLVTVPLEKKANGWTGDFLLKDADARLIVVLVRAGEKTDNNNGNCWTAMVYGADGKPVPGANIAYGNFLAGSGVMDFTHERDYDAGLAAIKEEQTLYPSNWKAYPAEWTILLRKSRGADTRPDLRSDVDRRFKQFGNDEDAESAMLYWLGQVGEGARADSIQKEAATSHPLGLITQRARENAISAERDPQRRADLLVAFLKDFPSPGPELSSLQAMLFAAYVQLKQPENALAVAERVKDVRTAMFNEIAWDWIEKGENLEKATALAKRGVDEAANPPDSLRPSYLSVRQWRDAIANNRAMVLDTYGYGLYKLGKIAEAETAFEGAYHGTKGDSPDITERLLMTYNKEGNYEKAATVGKEAVESGKSNDNILAYYREAYVKVHGSSKGFDESLAVAKDNAAKAAVAKILKSRISKPEIPFELKGMDGTTVKLADLKGKVVVIDFWATWCGPCKMSFPTLQKVYEKYASNDKVKILALDTWERVGGQDRIDLVKKFIAENKYTFPVLYDQDAVDRYGVDGIPTKFIIDKNGNIAFKSVGFYGENEMMSELTAQIETLLAE